MAETESLLLINVSDPVMNSKINFDLDSEQEITRGNLKKIAESIEWNQNNEFPNKFIVRLNGLC